MRAETETQSPRPKRTMSLFPNVLHPSTYSTLLGDRHKISATSARTDHQSEHQHAYHVDHHHIAAFFINFLSHVFAPTAYQQCTLSSPYRDADCGELASKRSDSTVIIVDDEFVLVESSDSEEQDGGPICREATIESWKAQKKRRSKYVDLRRWSDLPYFGCP